jgi:hypothetical protein
MSILNIFSVVLGLQEIADYAALGRDCITADLRAVSFSDAIQCFRKIVFSVLSNLHSYLVSRDSIRKSNTANRIPSCRIRDPCSQKLQLLLGSSQTGSCAGCK